MKNKKIILFLIASLFLFVGSVGAVTCPTNFSEVNNVCMPQGTQLPDPAGDSPLATVINNVMLWILRVVGFIAIIAFVISGMQYILAAGNQNIMETAKRNMVWSIVGVVVALMGMVIFIFIYNMLS